MDARVALGSLGYPVTAGHTYRFVAWLSNAAFGLPWNSPSTDDLTGAVRAAFPDAVVMLPWDALPTDWPQETVGMPGNGFFVRGEGTWKADGRTLPPTLPVTGSSEPLHIAAVWTHASENAPTPAPDANSAPDATPPPKPVADAPTAAPTRPPPVTPSPSPASNRAPPATPPPWRAPRRRGSGAVAKALLGAGALFGLVLAFARSTPARRRRAA